MTTWTPSSTTRSRSPGRTLLERVLGEAASGDEAFERIEEGLETRVLENFLELVPETRLALGGVLRLSERTLARRRSEGRFTPEESDRLYRLIELYAQAADVLESVEAADEWMNSPAVALGGRTPLAYAHNEAGARRVSTILTRIEHGVFS